LACCYIVGNCEVRPDERRILVGGEPAAIGSRAFDLLLYLLACRDRVVTKEELLQQVWPGVVVEEGNLTVHVSALRKLLGAQAIVTIPGRGYRFAMPVTEPAASLPPAEASAPRPLPDGVVTLLFTDIEGSTHLAETLGDSAWAELLEVHRTLLRRAFAARHGQEVDTQGDMLYFVFTKATDAAAAALSGQQALAAHEWPGGTRVRVRMGLHTGEVLLRGDQYVGQEVHRASRICDAGHGGQIVVSQTCADILQAGLPSGAALADLGAHRLKDFWHAQRLFQLTQTGLPLHFPPLRSIAAAHNLPVERSSFVGRGREIVAARSLLAEHRLVTLTGIGGSGKTRLALQVGALELSRFPDGVFFVDLAPVSDLEIAAQTMARACGLPIGDAMGGAGGSIVERLLGMLTRRKCLLLIDNCEHLVDVAADLVDRVLVGCAGVVILATSREPLGVEGEQLMQVPSLAVPDDIRSGEVTDAMRLFVDRARAVKLTFELDAQTHSAVAEICRRLDGIPLAIEFAAARMAHLSAAQIAERLGDRFRLLTGGRRRIQRQQTLAAALDWSHDLLHAEEQIVFRRLAVFAGVFRLEAAEAVCSGDDIAAERVLGLLGSLVSKSLVADVHDEAGDARYRLLETVRMYASDKLTSAGEADRVRSQHRDWCLRWLESMALEDLSFLPVSLKAVSNEIDNLRVAAEWSVREDRPDLLARLAVRLYGYWFEGNPNQEGRRWLEHALRDERRLSADQRVACNAVLCAIATLEHESDLSVRYATCAIDAAAGKASPFLATAYGLRAFGTSVMAGMMPPDTAARLLDQMRTDARTAVEMAQAGLPSPWRASAELWAAGAEANVGDLRVAAKWYSACVESCRAQGLPNVLWFALAELVGAQHLLGETEAALGSALRFLTLLDPTTNLTDWQRLCAIGLTPALYKGGRRDQANQLLRDVAPAFRRNGVRLAVNHRLTFAAVVNHLQGFTERAGRLMGAARHLGGAAKMAISFSSPISMCMYAHYLPLIRTSLGAEAAHRAREFGLAMTLDDALNYVIETPGLAAESDLS
jgi:predicted ATPase/class 3 adenylate cyclase